MSFVPLQVLSSYSLLQSTTKLDQLVVTAKERGYKFIAITDVNVLYGVIDFYQSAKRAGIQPLIGMTLKFPAAADGRSDTVVLLAKNDVGYHHLMQISTRMNTQERDQSIQLSDLADLMGDLFVIITTVGDYYRLVQAGDAEAANQYLHNWLQWTDADSLLMGINPGVDAIMRQTIQQNVAQSGVELVALSRVGYLDAEDHFAVEVLRAIDNGTQIDHPQQLATKLGDHFLKTTDQFEREYELAQLSTAVAKANAIALQCRVEFQSQPTMLPRFTNDTGVESFKYLQQQCLEGLKKRAVATGFQVQDYVERLSRELKVIHQMGFDDYFLIVGDVIAFAHQHQIITGPGRGSAAGSLVSYSLGITDVDPLQYNLLFERFLNPERAQMPDIDLDIPDDKRDVVLEYVHQKYGHDRVAQIITFGTLAAKQVLRDVGRVFGLSQMDQSDWSATIPAGELKISLANAYQQSQKLQNRVADSEQNGLLFKTASQLEGLPRHYSTHAAGIVLSNQPLDTLVPLQAGGEGMLMTQFAKDTVEELGLLKMDFLGLRNLSIMANAVALIQTQNPDFKVANITLDDQRTLNLFQHGDTNGVFQFESTGIKNVLVNLYPDNFELIVAVNALYRPGPMENIDSFIARKKGLEPITYPDESLKDILSVTYGILVYQEQVMQAASAMANFSLGEADLLRRAMSKKKKSVMDSMRAKFISGAAQNGHSREVAEKVFDYIDQFANYGFNRSHAVAYSKLAFELAYLKAWYPAAFLIALLNTVVNNPTKIKLYLTEAQRHHVKVHGPNINLSMNEFTLQDGEILFGLSSVKGIRRDMIADILAEREQGGPFTGLLSFLQRIDPRWLKEDLITPLVAVGAFDGLGNNRAELLEAVAKFIDSVKLTGSSMSLFEDLQPTVQERKELTLEQRLEFEEEYLGAYLSGHPVSQFDRYQNQLGVTPIAELVSGKAARIFLFVSRVKVIRTKRGEQMAFLVGSDQSSSIDVTVFPQLFRQVEGLLVKNKILLIDGRVETNRGLQVVANQIRDAREFVKQLTVKPAQRWVLRLDADHQSPALLQLVYQTLERDHGQTPVLIFNQVNDEKLMQPQQRWISARTAVGEQLKQLLGTNNVVLQQLKKDD